jgi:hypothetical protein
MKETKQARKKERDNQIKTYEERGEETNNE